MEVKRCSRCGAFYTNQGYVCSKCINKDNLELNHFKNFIEENEVEINSLSQVSMETGISEQNLNRFINYEGLEKFKDIFNNKIDI